MTRESFVRALALATLALLGSLAGCRSHQMRASSPGTTTVCRACYDAAVRAWDRGRYHGAGYTGARWGYVPSSRVYIEHQCAECDSTAVVHTEEGRWMITCPRCAPKGVPCDKCLPPEGASRASAGPASSPKQSP
jgi:hypothetical protein